MEIASYAQTAKVKKWNELHVLNNGNKNKEQLCFSNILALIHTTKKASLE